MGKQLVIVESPAKSKTIYKYLGRNYLVKASMGHVKDLPKSKLAVDIENDFKPHYQIIPQRKKIIAELKKSADGAEGVFIATDPDREGEAISWHLKEILEKINPRIYRVLFHEITEKAIREAFRNYGDIDVNKVMAQQTRRVLDRLAGYLVSPLLWKKVGKGLSAGRVQSVALRMICEREKEIKAFVPEEYWTITAILSAENPPSFKSKLSKIEGEKAEIKNEPQANEIVEELKKLNFILDKIEKKEKKKHPPPPFITSSLQQESYRRLGFPVKKTMNIAQKLYEGVEIGDEGPVGLITYMRTDSFRISWDSINEAREFIKSNFSENFLPQKPNIWRNKRKAQDAHEAIRPTSVFRTPESIKSYLSKDEFNLYSLVWKRFVGFQMASALIEETKFFINAGKYLFISEGEVILFPGYLILAGVSEDKDEKIQLPEAKEGEILKLEELIPKQNFTQPPPRYSEASLVRELEEKGIGRPSTYATIISTLQNRVYVFKEDGKFVPTELGMHVVDLLIKHFPELMDYEFTANMEKELDRISEGEEEWVNSLRNFYSILDEKLKNAYKIMESSKSKGIPTEEKCPKCGNLLVIKSGKYGSFLSCSNYPDCDYTSPLIPKKKKFLDEKCPQCSSPLQYRKGKYGLFVACSNYPNCNYIKKNKEETDFLCPNGCGGKLIKRRGKRGREYYTCSSYPDCKYVSGDKIIEKACPECNWNYLVLKTSKKTGDFLYCPKENCNYKEKYLI
ncbi:MAG: type I DNA topoisomerase [Acidobacteriota bacterium]